MAHGEGGERAMRARPAPDRTRFIGLLLRYRRTRHRAFLPKQSHEHPHIAVRHLIGSDTRRRASEPASAGIMPGRMATACPDIQGSARRSRGSKLTRGLSNPGSRSGIRQGYATASTFSRRASPSPPRPEKAGRPTRSLPPARASEPSRLRLTRTVGTGGFTAPFASIGACQQRCSWSRRRPINATRWLRFSRCSGSEAAPRCAEARGRSRRRVEASPATCQRCALLLAARCRRRVVGDQRAGLQSREAGGRRRRGHGSGRPDMTLSPGQQVSDTLAPWSSRRP